MNQPRARVDHQAWLTRNFKTLSIVSLLQDTASEMLYPILPLFLTGVFDSVSVIVRSTLIHTYTPEYMKGRVSAVNNIFIGSSNEIGAFESGAAAKVLGTAPSVIFGGIMTLLVVAFTAWRADKLRALEMGAGKKTAPGLPEPEPVQSQRT